ncbi:NAD(P)/FAD-dependent oxidoreductase [Vallicoccus soli]|uniref:NAD(P)/FAD-dependent oxidoreductase n=1 Tax=Vallicoccus soli TaxID=2339232 RepID=A0A3A3ZNA7_9ACTN|nr:NAD(P)/FAD-dependent oxidoreductase [Vallicoccus soli]
MVVVGGGPTGENVASRAVEGGLTAVLVEHELLGGECSYWACMPSKALLRDTEVLAEAAALPGAAAAVTGRVDVRAVLDRRDAFTSHWRDDGQVAWAEGAGIAVVRGHGRLAGERRVVVEGAYEGSQPLELRARHAVVLATGSVAAVPPVPGLREARPWTSREATSAEQVPEHLVVVGGGVVGCEMSTAWSRLGARVTLLNRGDRLLPGLEPFAGELVAQRLRDGGVDVRLGASPAAVRRDGDGPTTVVLEDGAEVTGDALLVATGRRPATADVGLDAVGLEPGSYLDVDDTLRVAGVPWLYAAGDCNGRNLLTHMGKYQARCCADAVVARSRGEQASPDDRWARWTATADAGACPSVVFADPQVGTVGRTEAAAREAGLRVRCVEVDLNGVSGASLLGDDDAGRAKLVVDEDRRVVVGATFAGRGTAELLHSATVAVVGEVPLERLWHAVPSYPTVSEAWLRLLEAYGL